MPYLNWLERGFVKPTWHLALAMVFTVALVVFDFAVHASFRSDYERDTDPLVARASQQYFFELNAPGKGFVLMLERTQLEELPEDERSGPLGIGDTPSFRGVIARHGLAARELERQLVEVFAAKFAAFSRERGGTYKLALPGLDQDQFVRVEGDALEQCFESPDLTSPRRLEALLLRSDLWAIEAPADVQMGGSRRLPAIVNAGLQSIAAALAAVRKLSAAQVVEFSPEARETVRTWVRQGFDALLQEDSDGAASSSAPDAGEPSLHALSRTLTCRLQRDVAELARAELTTGIWIYGPWRWLEIVFWVWFGVLTNALYGVGAIAVGMRKVTFEPRETQWMFARMLYAPLLAIIFFWIAESAIPFLGPEALLFNSTLLGLAIAFLIGMYPDNIYQLLATFFHRVLHSSKSADDRSKPKLQQVLVASGIDPQAPPQLSDLADRIAGVLTAPLRKGAT